MFLWAGMSTAVIGAGLSDLSELKGFDEIGKGVTDASGNSAEAITIDSEATPEAVYVENHWFQDFEVHFFISLPFTAFFSYLSVMSVDALVQGKFTPDFHQADIWMIAGFTVGSSLAVALGSVNRVPDQSIQRMQDDTAPVLYEKEKAGVGVKKIEVVRINY